MQFLYDAETPPQSFLLHPPSIQQQSQPSVSADTRVCLCPGCAQRMLAAFAHGAAAYSSARAHAKVLSTAGEKLGGMGVQLWVTERAAVLSVLAEGSLWQVRPRASGPTPWSPRLCCNPSGRNEGEAPGFETEHRRTVDGHTHLYG
jgi:hypothetical protein